MPTNLTEYITDQGTAYVESGRGEPLVLIHGVGLNKQVWEPQLNAFSNQYRVIAYDTLGHGKSPVPGEDLTLDDYFKQLVDLLDTLEIDRINLCGHSMGALITIGFALRYPQRVIRIIPMMGAFDRSPEHQKRSLRVADILAGPEAKTLLESTLKRWFTPEDNGDIDRVEKIAQVEAWLNQADKSGYSRAYRVFAHNGETYVGKLGDISQPALFITAENDPNSTPAMSTRMAAEVQQGKVHILLNERHMGQYLAAKKIEPILRQFLAIPIF